MAILKALPGSAKINGKPIKGKLIQIKRSVINIDKFLGRRNKVIEKKQEILRKQNQNLKRKKKELKLEQPKKEWKKLVPKKVPGLSFFDSIRKFVVTWILGFVAIKLIPLLPKLIPTVLQLGKIVNWFINIGGAFLNGFINFIHFGVKAGEATHGFITAIAGEKFANAMANFAKGFGGVIDAMLLTGIFLIGEALAGDSGLGLIGDWISDKLLKKFFGKATASTATTALTKTGATTALTKTGAAAAATASGGAAAGGGGAASGGGAAGVGAGAAAGIVAGAGLLASGLGEGAFQLKKVAQDQEAKSYKRFKDKGWWNPMKYFWGAVHLMDKFSSYFIGNIGVLLDIIGAPFRYLIELIRYPFLSEEGKKKQAENLAKFDARIREQFRENLNAFSLGMLAKEKGSFGSMFGKKGTDAMGYTKDGKTKSQQVPGTKGTILLATPHLTATQDFLKGKSSGEKVHTILKVSTGKDTSDVSKTTGLSKTTDGTSKTTDPSKVAAKPKGRTGAIIGGALGSALGPLGIIAGAAIGSSIQKRGIKGVIGGAADFVTGGMFDFDNQNRKGAPKDFGIRRIAGGLTDWATMGLTDFDKRGKGNLQFDPIGGGKDKAWGSRNEQAKRREKQSGFGLKRGIGGLLDFATLGMFDFDKQNRRGAPKGFGIKRIAGGLADFVTAGATDFDKRGTGIGQMNLGEKISKKKAYEKYLKSDRYMNKQARISNIETHPLDRKNLVFGNLNDGKPMSQRELYALAKSGDEEAIRIVEGMDQMQSKLPEGGSYTWNKQTTLTNNQGSTTFKESYSSDDGSTDLKLGKQDDGSTDLKLGKQPVKFDEELLGVSASYEVDGGQKEFVIYAPTTQINMLTGNNGGDIEYVSSGESGSSEDAYQILEKGN